MKPLYVEFTGQLSVPYVVGCNGRTYAFAFVPAVDAWGTKYQGQVARINFQEDYRWLIENDPNLRPYVITDEAEATIKKQEREAQELADKQEKEERLRYFRTALKELVGRKAGLVEEAESLAGQAKLKMIEAEALDEQINNHKVILGSMEEQPEPDPVPEAKPAEVPKKRQPNKRAKK